MAAIWHPNCRRNDPVADTTDRRGGHSLCRPVFAVTWLQACSSQRRSRPVARPRAGNIGAVSNRLAAAPAGCAAAGAGCGPARAGRRRGRVAEVVASSQGRPQHKRAAWQPVPGAARAGRRNGDAWNRNAAGPHVGSVAASPRCQGVGGASHWPQNLSSLERRQPVTPFAHDSGNRSRESWAFVKEGAPQRLQTQTHYVHAQS